MSFDPSSVTGADGVAVLRAPMFFLSHARTPPLFDEHDPDPDKLVFEFYTELNRQVERLAGIPPGIPVGYVERPGDPAARVLDALARSRVFVPLCSPRYFATSYCGRQWHAFTRRTNGNRAVVPVVWAPVVVSQQPSAAREHLSVEPFGDPLPPQEQRSASRYATDGLYALITLQEDDEAYRLTVRRLAERVVRSARASAAVEADSSEWEPLDRTPNAFEEAQPRPHLGIAVLAPTRDGLPNDRSANGYGASPLDWQPYGGPSRPSLARRMVELSRNLGYAPEVRVFDDSLGELLGSSAPHGPWALLVDPWALYDRDARELLRRFDALDAPWATVITVLSVSDQQNVQRQDSLRRWMRETLPRRLARSRMTNRAAINGIPNYEAFSRVFAELVESAVLHFLMGTQIGSGPQRRTSGGERPRLGIDPLSVHEPEEDGGGGPEETR